MTPIAAKRAPCGRHHSAHYGRVIFLTLLLRGHPLPGGGWPPRNVGTRGSLLTREVAPTAVTPLLQSGVNGWGSPLGDPETAAVLAATNPQRRLQRTTAVRSATDHAPEVTVCVPCCTITRSVADLAVNG